MELEIRVLSDFRTKRLRAYPVPELLKPEVRRQIRQLYWICVVFKSEMGSLIVCVVKGLRGENGVRLAIDYRFVDTFSQGDAFPTPDVDDANFMMASVVHNRANAHLVLITLNPDLDYQSNVLGGQKTGLSASGTVSPVVWVLWDPRGDSRPKPATSRPRDVWGDPFPPTFVRYIL